MKELLKKAFEAGKDKQWDIEWQMGRSKPDFNEWYKEHENEALRIQNVVGRSEQLPNRCSVCGRTDEERLTMTSMCGVSACPY
jgi:hypothetical protein